MYNETFTQQFPKMLHNMNQILNLAQSHAQNKKFEVEVLLNSRLAPDQFNFIRQIQIVCDTAKLGAARLTGKEAPKHEDNEKTLPELQARLESVIGYLQTFKAADFANTDKQVITQPRWEGKTMLGKDYFIQHVLPNFYFHFTTAYSILRHNGVDVGKKNYLGEMPYQK